MKTTQYIGRCKGCGGCVRVSGEVEVKSSKGSYGRTVCAVTVRFPHGEVYRSDSSERVFFKCLCGDRRYVEFRRVRGIVTAHECNDKCMSSTSFKCECSCGGANHGGSHAA